MLIAFEGPDNVGKSTSAHNLSGGSPIYNATKYNHTVAGQDIEDGVPRCFDRIDWFSHMVYRLALPKGDWNDDRSRTVFAMPDTHLVIKLHRPDLAEFTADEVVVTPIGLVNPMYYYFANFFTGLNEEQNFELFKSVSIIEVSNDVYAGTFSQELVSFSSPVTSWGEAEAFNVIDDASLLKLLRAEEHQTI